MSGRRFELPASGRGGTGRLAAAVGRLRTRLDAPVDGRTAAGVVAVVPVVGVTLYRVAHNAPGTLPPVAADLAALARPAAVLGPALAALVLAGVAATAAERVGLALAGGFGALTLAPPAAWHPAAAGLVAGGGLAVGGRLWRSGCRDRRLGRLVPAAGTAPATALVVAVAVSLAAAAGVASPTLRPLGTGLALVGVVLTPLATGLDRIGLAAGAVAAGVTVGLASTLPYVAGAVFLVGGAVVGAPLALVAFAVGGGVAGVVGAARSGGAGQTDGCGRTGTPAAFGAALLLAAGVPGSLPRALAAVVGVALLVGVGRARPASGPDAGTPEAATNGGEPA